MANEQNLKPFQPNDGEVRDKRINRKGRPRSFDALRELAKQIAVDVAKDNKGNEIAIPGIDDRITVVQAILLQMSRDPRRQKEFLEIAFGKVPDELNVKGEMKVIKVTLDGSNQDEA
jgi:hypothetical protein